MEKKEKILIIKTGYSEVLEGENDSRTPSYGDILRTTAILHLYKNDHVTWVTDIRAFPLLEGNPYVDRLLSYDFIVAEQLKTEKFDTLINFEKIPGICALTDKINAWKKYGFRFDSETGKAKAYERAFEILAVSANSELKKKNERIIQDLLFEMIGFRWNEEEIILGYKPESDEIYDIGLNTTVGSKWPTKLWSKEKWDALEEKLKSVGIKVSRQDSEENQKKGIMKNLRLYMDWINSCKIIISSDSLGLHLAIALKKKVLGLFGPTQHKEVFYYGRGKSILPEFVPECSPCFEGKCRRGRNCMEDISINRVYNETIKMLQENPNG